jgi:cell division protein FtsI/penicillin-binding protein 2
VRTRRIPALLLALLAAGAMLAGCSNTESDVRDAAQKFLTAWSGGHLDTASQATTDAAAVDALLKRTAADLPGATLAASLGKVSVKGSSATVTWQATWHLKAAPDWRYSATLKLRDSKSWQVVADPTIVHPALGAGQHLVLARSLPPRAAMTDANGVPIFTPTEVVNVGVDTGKVTDLPALAAGLSAATGIAAADITKAVTAAPKGQFVPVITLRRPDFEAIRSKVFDLPGAVFPTSTRLLAPTSRFAVALLGRVGSATADVLKETSDHGRPRYATTDQLGLSGLQRAFQQQLTGTPGFTVTVVSTDESTGDTGRQIGAVAPVPGTPVKTTIVTAVQEAADAAVATEKLPTHLVVLRPGTGEILAVASNAAADPGHALTGHFPPGSAMKTMTATALLAAGKVTPNTQVPCPGTTTVDGRQFQNENKFDLGTVSLTVAFAQSCNTTFIQQAMTLPDDALAAAAHSYGVGATWKLPVGIFSGSVPAAATGTTKAADAIGQGQVVMSPAALALVAAGIASGKPAPPAEVVGAPPAGQAPQPPSAAVLDALRPMMRQVVLAGTARGVSGQGEVYGKTGTAEFGDKTPPDSHGWFMGYRLSGGGGPLAFATLVEAGQSSGVAVRITSAFLAALH